MCLFNLINLSQGDVLYPSLELQILSLEIGCDFDYFSWLVLSAIFLNLVIHQENSLLVYLYRKAKQIWTGDKRSWIW